MPHAIEIGAELGIFRVRRVRFANRANRVVDNAHIFIDRRNDLRRLFGALLVELRSQRRGGRFVFDIGRVCVRTKERAIVTKRESAGSSPIRAARGRNDRAFPLAFAFAVTFAFALTPTRVPALAGPE